MQRDKKLVAKRIKLVGLFLEIKKERGDSRKKAVLDVSELLFIAKDTVLKDFQLYNKLKV
jgi:hypothetical protein